MKRVAVFTAIPTPYRDPYWFVVEEMNRLHLDVFYLSKGKQDRPWNVTWDFPSNGNILEGYNLLGWKSHSSSNYWNPSIIKILNTGNYDVLIVGGYNHASLLCVILFAQLAGIPWILMCESFRIKSSPRLWSSIRKLILRFIINGASGGIPTGVKASEFLCHFGVEKKNITLIPNVPNLSQATKGTRKQGELMRNRFGIPLNAKILLYVGRIIPKKRVDLLIRCFELAKLKNNYVLVIVGEGDERLRMELLARQLMVGDRVFFTGFLEPQNVSEMYAESDLFILLSNETWGVAPIEASAMGLPVILSSQVGCATDLKQLAGDQINIVNTADIGEVVNTIQVVVSSTSSNQGFSTVKLIDSWSYPALADRFVKLVERIAV